MPNFSIGPRNEAGTFNFYDFQNSEHIRLERKQFNREVRAIGDYRRAEFQGWASDTNWGRCISIKNVM